MKFIFDKYVLITASVASLILMSLFFLATNAINPTANAIVSNSQLSIQHSFIVDPYNQFDISNMSKLPFASNRGKNVPWTFGDQGYWLKYTLANHTNDDKELVMHLDNPMLNNLVVYQVDSQHRVLKKRSLGWKNQSLSLLNRSTSNFKFNLAAQSSDNLYIHLSTQGITKTPVTLYSPDDFQAYVRSIHIIWGAFIGIICMIALYNLVIYSGLKEPVYLIYIMYLMSVLSLTAISKGFGHYIFPAPLFSILRPNVITLNFLTLACALHFAVHFLNFHTNKKVYWYCLRAFYFIISCAVVSFFVEENTSAPLFFIVMGFSYFLCFWLLYKSYKNNHQWSRLYTISWVPLLIGGAIQPMELTDVIPYSFLTRQVFPICILIEITLMAMALTQRLRQQKQRADFNASHDLETGLPNYQALDTSLAIKLDNKWSFTLCLIEIAGLNRLSPYLSTHQSQQVLKNLLQGVNQYTLKTADFLVIQETLYPNEKIARVKENIFAIMLAESSEREYITQQLVPIHNLVQKTLQNNNPSIHLKAYIGYYQVNDNVQLPSDIVKKTFQAISTAALKGLDINAFESHQHLSLNVASDLETALISNQLELYHQPQIALNGNKVHGSEALLRWKHPVNGFIEPEILIDLAENIGLINQLTLWIIAQACRDIQSLVSQGYHQHKVSVNISPSDVADHHFLDNLTLILERYSIPNHLLSLELTESVMVNDYQHLNKVMNGLSKLGIGVSIDDFGTGYSSLTHLSQLPFNELKIDKIFIQSLDSNKRNQNIVETTIHMAKALNLRVVAEGIETQAVVDTLKDCGCEIVQGYFYSKPKQFSEYLQWLHLTKPISSDDLMFSVSAHSAYAGSPTDPLQ
jgi:EAL domain-containing protein (putative c-di-GMP-specific phosphodiesterase class I)/GGDEF domain-containing protein